MTSGIKSFFEHWVKLGLFFSIHYLWASSKMEGNEIESQDLYPISLLRMGVTFSGPRRRDLEAEATIFRWCFCWMGKLKNKDQGNSTEQTGKFQAADLSQSIQGAATAPWDCWAKPLRTWTASWKKVARDFAIMSSVVARLCLKHHKIIPKGRNKGDEMTWDTTLSDSLEYDAHPFSEDFIAVQYFPRLACLPESAELRMMIILVRDMDGWCIYIYMMCATYDIYIYI